MNIAVIGGSIAGCALALLLKDKFNITVYERTTTMAHWWQDIIRNDKWYTSSDK